MDEKGRVLQLELGECLSSFNMEKAVCNHGWFMMAPNHWIPSTKSLCRPLRLADSSRSVLVTISHPPNHPYLVIQVSTGHGVHSLSSADEAAILEQVARMLRISNKDERDVREFQRLHSSAKEMGFGRIFRSPSFFEDAVKSILLCNCGWKRTLTMAQALCKLQAEMANANSHNPRGKRLKRKKGSSSTKWSSISNKFDDDDDEPNIYCTGNFPTSTELGYLDEKYLEKKHCHLGYRGRHILELARKIENGELVIDEVKQLELSSDTAISACYEMLYQKLMKIKGFGPFICSNIMMCVGYYKRIPSDTETIRHLKEAHGKKNCCITTIEKDNEEIYGEYNPFQCIAYWFEMVEEYENKFGKLSELDSCCYHLVTGTLPACN